MFTATTVGGRHGEPTGERRWRRRPWVVEIDPALPTEFFVYPEDAMAFSYRLWLKDSGREWIEIGSEEMAVECWHHWLLMPPVAMGTEFAYSLEVGGCAGSFWRVQIGVRQVISRAPYGWTTRASWTEAGVLNDNGVAETGVIAGQRQTVLLRA